MDTKSGNCVKIKKTTDCKKINAWIITLLVIIFILLAASFFTTILHLKDYNRQRSSGNNRWLEVENLLNGYDLRIKELENKVEGV